MAKARRITDLDAETRFGDAAAAAVDVRSAEVFEHATGVLDVDDIERVHDMRVATRRLRAVLEVFARCFPKKEHKRLLREVKDLADVLGERRDPDVAIASLERISESIGDDAGPGIESLVDHFRVVQERANAQLAEALTEVRESDLQGRLLALADSARAQAAPSGAAAGDGEQR